MPERQVMGGSSIACYNGVISHGNKMFKKAYFQCLDCDIYIYKTMYIDSIKCCLAKICLSKDAKLPTQNVFLVYWLH